MSTLAVGFTSCSDDDEEGDGPVGGLYTGVWEMTHIKIVENGEPEEADVAGSGSVIKLTLLDNGNYSYYALAKEIPKKRMNCLKRVEHGLTPIKS